MKELLVKRNEARVLTISQGEVFELIPEIMRLADQGSIRELAAAGKLGIEPSELQELRSFLLKLAYQK